MDIVIVGIDLGKNSCVALWRWRRAAARTIRAGCLPLRDTRSA